MTLSIIIPTYKNTDMLLKNLRHNMQFLKTHEVIVVNDFPEDSIGQWMKDQFPSIRLIENEKNVGFGLTVNAGVKAASGDLIMLLNNDVILTDTSYENAFKHFETDKNLFGVSFAQKEKDGTIVGKNRIYWQKGFFQHAKANNLSFGINAWAEGGSAIIDKQKFNQIGGFDNLYSPFYWEDIDLSYQAWKKGYKILFDPEILVEHHHESTIGKFFDTKRIDTIAFRNQILFIWKNISSSSLMFVHLFFLLKHVLYYLLKGETVYAKSFFQAITRIPHVINSRSTSHSKLTDHEILSFFQK